jgi:ABC-type phosphate transport system auxiliary subunit
VWDKPLQGVVGMAVPAEKKREGVKAAFRMPITVLVETGDFLHQAMQQKPINSSRSFNRVQEIKVRELEKRFAILEIDYQAVYNQLNETLDAEFKNKIQLKLKRIEQEMNDVFGELKMVG